MNEDEVRRLLDKAASGPVDVDRVDPDAIVRLGRRDVARRRQIGIAAAGAAAAVLALGAAVGIPLTIGGNGETAERGGAAPQDLPTVPADDDFLNEWSRADHGNCPEPGGQTDEQERTADAYNQVLFEALKELGGEPLGRCLETRPDYDGVYYSEEQGAYIMDESFAFGDGSTSDWAWVRGGSWEAGGVNYESQMEEKECPPNPNVECSWEDVPEGRVLLIEGSRTDFVDADTEAEGAAEFPVVAAFLFREDVVVTLDLSLRFESDRQAPSIDQVVDIIRALPAGEEAPEVEVRAWDDVAADLAAAAEREIPGIEVDTDTAEFVRLAPEVATYGGPVYGTDATRMVFVLAELESGETVRLFLQAEPVEDAGGDPAVAAASFAQCSDVDCETAADGPGDASVHRTITEGRPSSTSLEYRVGDGWVIGVGVEAVDGSEAPPVDFATLDAILGGIR